MLLITEGGLVVYLVSLTGGVFSNASHVKPKLNMGWISKINLLAAGIIQGNHLRFQTHG